MKTETTADSSAGASAPSPAPPPRRLAPRARRRTPRGLFWFLPALTSLALAGVFGTGFFLALTGRFGEILAPLPPAAAAPKTGAVRIVALGDSITAGVGDAGGGYARRVADSLRRSGRVVIFNNLAVNGSETGDVLDVMKGAAARRELEAADIVLVSAAGNDLNHGLRKVMGETAAGLPESTLVKTRENLRKIVADLRALNPTASIRLLGLYNPYPVEAADLPEARGLLLDWNVAIAQAALPDPAAVVVPIADLFESRTDLLAGDRFHPGARGHELIAARVLGTLAESRSAR